MNKNYLSNIVVSVFAFVICSLLLVFTVKEGLTRVFAGDVVNEMAALDMIKKREVGVSYDEDSHIFEFIKNLSTSEEDQLVIRKRYNKIAYMFFILPCLLIFILVFVRGWSNVKSKVKKVDYDLLKDKIPIDYLNKISWYVSDRTFSYGFLSKKIILGSNYFFASKEERNFILSHEFNHLRFKDSIIKNYLLNLKKFFFPIFCIIYFVVNFFVSVFQILFPWIESDINSAPDINSTQLLVIISYGVLPLLMIFLFNASFRKFTTWFSYAKEFLSDKYAFLNSNGFVPRFKESKDKFHPSEVSRRGYLKDNNRPLSIYPVFLFTIALVNINFCMSFVSDEYYFFSLFALLLLLIIFELLLIKLHTIGLMDVLRLTFLLAVFVGWNYFISNFHSNNGTFSYSPVYSFINIFGNITLFVLIVLFYLAGLVSKYLFKKK